MNNTSKTDWEALAAMTDEEIDYSEIAPLSATFFERARVWQPQPKVTLTMQVDADIVEWFQTASDNWEAQVQAALRFYVESTKHIKGLKPNRRPTLRQPDRACARASGGETRFEGRFLA